MVKYKWLGKTRSNFRVKIKQRQMTVRYEFAGHSNTLKNSTTILNILPNIFLSSYLFYSARNILMGSNNKSHFILLSNSWQQKIHDWMKTIRHHWNFSQMMSFACISVVQNIPPLVLFTVVALWFINESWFLLKLYVSLVRPLS